MTDEQYDELLHQLKRIAHAIEQIADVQVSDFRTLDEQDLLDRPHQPERHFLE